MSQSKKSIIQKESKL